MLKFSKFRFFKILIFLSEKNLKICFKFLSLNYFSLEKKFSENMFHLYQFKFPPGFQKSYLENRARTIKMRKLQLQFVCMFETQGIIHLVTSSGSPLTWGPQAGSEVMEHVFSQSARENMNCSSRQGVRLISDFLQSKDTY